MDAAQRTRRCCRTRETGNRPDRGEKQICLPMSRETCERIGSDPQTVRAVIEDTLRQSPELFPTGMVQGFGHDAHFGDRHVERLGHNSVVGTTVRDPNQLPDHLTADEHHTDGCGQKGSVSLTAGEGCVLGIALTPSASD